MLTSSFRVTAHVAYVQLRCVRVIDAELTRDAIRPEPHHDEVQPPTRIFSGPGLFGRAGRSAFWLWWHGLASHVPGWAVIAGFR